MKHLLLAGAALLAMSCSGAGGGGSNLSKEKLADEIVEAGGVISLDKETLERVITIQLQDATAQNPTLTPEQQVKLSTALRGEIEKGVVDLKKQMAGFLVEKFDQKELANYHAFVTATEQQKIKTEMPSVMQMSLAAADAMTMKAVNNAMKAEGLKEDAAPGAGHGAPPGATADPAAPAPAPAPAIPAKPQ
jgi:hypothetical protein